MLYNQGRINDMFLNLCIVIRIYYCLAVLTNSSDKRSFLVLKGVGKETTYLRITTLNNRLNIKCISFIKHKKYYVE